MKQLLINHHRFENPSKWDELNAESLRKIAVLSVEQMPASEFKLKVLMAHHSWKASIQKRKGEYLGQSTFLIEIKSREFAWITAADLAFLSSSFDFLFEEVTGKDNQVHLKISSQLSSNKFPEIIIDKVSYAGPADKLTNLVYKEWELANTFYYRFQKSQDTKYLDLFMATLYRKKAISPTDEAYKGDCRESLNEYRLEEDAKTVSAIPGELKLATLFFWEGCCKLLSYNYPNTFGEADDDKPAADPFHQFQILKDRLSWGDVTKVSEIDNIYLYTVLQRIETARKDEIATQKKIKSAQNHV